MTWVENYLADIAPDRAAALSAVREVILANLPDGYIETQGYGMISYVVPLEVFSHTYNGRPLVYAALANQKRYMSLYLMSVYQDERRRKRFEDSYRDSGKKADLGKSCVRFKRLDDLPLDLIGQAIASVSVADFVASYEAIKGLT